MGRVLETRSAVTAGAALVDGERQAQHGDPVPNMRRFARLVEAYLDGRTDLTPRDGAMIALLLKVSRVAANPALPDNYDDIEGYVEIARRCTGIIGDEETEAQRRTEAMT